MAILVTGAFMGLVPFAGPASERTWQGNSGGANRVLCTCFLGGKWQNGSDLPGFGVLLAEIALYNVYERVPAIKTIP
jgi:hypothetical protein